MYHMYQFNLILVNQQIEFVQSLECTQYLRLSEIANSLRNKMEYFWIHIKFDDRIGLPLKTLTTIQVLALTRST